MAALPVRVWLLALLLLAIAVDRGAVAQTSTKSRTESRTPSKTRTGSRTPTKSLTPSRSPSPASATASPTVTSTWSMSASGTVTATASTSASASSTVTSTATSLPSVSLTASPSTTSTASTSSSSTLSGTQTSSATVSGTPTGLQSTTTATPTSSSPTPSPVTTGLPSPTGGVTRTGIPPESPTNGPAVSVVPESSFTSGPSGAVYSLAISATKSAYSTASVSASGSPGNSTAPTSSASGAPRQCQGVCSCEALECCSVEVDTKALCATESSASANLLSKRTIIIIGSVLSSLAFVAAVACISLQVFMVCNRRGQASESRDSSNSGSSQAAVPVAVNVSQPARGAEVPQRVPLARHSTLSSAGVQRQQLQPHMSLDYDPRRRTAWHADGGVAMHDRQMGTQAVPERRASMYYQDHFRPRPTAISASDTDTDSSSDNNSGIAPRSGGWDTGRHEGSTSGRDADSQATPPETSSQLSSVGEAGFEMRIESGHSQELPSGFVATGLTGGVRRGVGPLSVAHPRSRAALVRRVSSRTHTRRRLKGASTSANSSVSDRATQGNLKGRHPPRDSGRSKYLDPNEVNLNFVMSGKQGSSTARRMLLRSPSPQRTAISAK